MRLGELTVSTVFTLDWPLILSFFFFLVVLDVFSLFFVNTNDRSVLTKLGLSLPVSYTG